MSTFRWLERYTGFCVSVVDHSDAAKVLAAFGGTPSEAVRGGPREAQGCYAEEFGFRPVLRIVERGGWSVVVEVFSAEGLRTPVLRRLADVGRVVAFGLGEGGYRLGYADGAGVAVPVALRDGEVVARRAGVSVVSVDGGPDEGSAHAAIEFVAAVSGVVLDDGVMKSPGLVGRVLPVLPEADVRVAASLSGAAERARAVVSEHVRVFLAEVGIATGELVDAVSRYGKGQAVDLVDESGAGVALRELLAGESLITGSGPAAVGGSRHDVEAIRQRVGAGWAAVALLRGGPSAAVGQMVHRRRGADWRARLAGELETVPDGDPDVAASAAAVEARRARSTQVPAELFKTRPDDAGGRAQAAPAGEVRLAPGRFVRRGDEGRS